MTDDEASRRAARFYAIDLLKRASDAIYDGQDIANVAGVVALIEEDIASYVQRIDPELARFIREHRHRPAEPAMQPAEASLRSNVR